MLGCKIKQNSEYLSLSKRASIPEYDLDSLVESFLGKHQRLPHLDELKGADSEEYIKEYLQMRKDDSTSVENILEVTGTDTILEAQAKLNNTFTDKEINLIQIDDEVLVDIRRRPSEYDEEFYPPIDIDENMDENKSRHIISNGLYKLQDLYGINIKTITNEDLENMNFPVDVSIGKAFIYNGDIYVNIDKATADSLVHELLHILLGATRYIDPELYLSMVQSVLNFPNIEDLVLDYPNRTLNDVLEEIFVDLFAKFLTGQLNQFDNPNILYEAMRLVKRLLDTILEGTDTVGLIPNLELVTETLTSLAKKVNSPILNNLNSVVNLAYLHRSTANAKQHLLETNQLILKCD